MNSPDTSLSTEATRIMIQAVHNRIDELGVGTTARLLGIDRSTISRRLSAQRLDSWSLRDFLILCRADPRPGGLGLYDTIGHLLHPSDGSTTDPVLRHGSAALRHLGESIATLADLMEKRDQRAESVHKLIDQIAHLQQLARELERTRRTMEGGR